MHEAYLRLVGGQENPRWDSRWHFFAAAAEALYREALDTARKAMGEDDEYALLAMNNLGFLLYKRGALEEAEAMLRDSLERCRWKMGVNHRITLQAMGAVLRDQGKPAIRH